MTTTTPLTIDDLAADLKKNLDVIDRAQEAVNSLKPLIADMITRLPPDKRGKPVKTYRVSWGQLQRTVAVEWSYRDAGVTQAADELAKAEAHVAALRKVLKSRQEAAKAAKKAKPVGEKVVLRVVRGESINTTPRNQESLLNE